MILVSASVDRLLRLLQLSQSGEMAKYIPADMLEALMHIVYQGTVLAAEGRLPMHFRWHWKLFARTRFIVENRRRGLKFIQSGGAGGRQLVLVLRNFR